MINRSNYESYFIDYIDGNLPNDLVDEFLDFLKGNPDLAEELKAVSGIKLHAEPGIFANKTKLYKTDDVETADFQSVAFIEGDLNEQEEQQFLDDLATDDAKLKDLQLLQKIKLQPDLAIRFPEKEKMLHRPKPIYLWPMRIAALLLLFFSVWALIPRKNQVIPEAPIAQQITPSHETQNEDSQEVTAKPEIEEPAQTENMAVADVPETKPIVREKPNALQTDSPSIDDRTLIAVREDIPNKMQPLNAHLDLQKVVVSEVYITTRNQFPSRETLSVDEFLAYKLIDAPKGESFTINNLTNAGLRAAQNISNDRFEVERNAKGKVEEIKFESRLIAFSIPFKKNR